MSSTVEFSIAAATEDWLELQEPSAQGNHLERFARSPVRSEIKREQFI
jgi:hypothetical protein